MIKRTKALTNKTLFKKRDSVSKTNKVILSQSIATPMDKITSLQKDIGNHTIQRLLKDKTIQAKLQVGQPGHTYEQEADIMAEEIMCTLEQESSGSGKKNYILNLKKPRENHIQLQSPNEQNFDEGNRRQKYVNTINAIFANPKLLEGKLPADLNFREIIEYLYSDPRWNITGLKKSGKSLGEGLVLNERNERGTGNTGRYILYHPGEGHHGSRPYWKVGTGKSTIRVRSIFEEPRFDEEEEETGQAKMDGERNSIIPNQLESGIHSLDGSGQHLSTSIRAFFEPRFGCDFSKVRVNADSRAAKTAKLLNAKAFTTGSNIVFGTGQYSPDTTTGKRLLAHELTHVIQQTITLTPRVVSEIEASEIQRKIMIAGPAKPYRIWLPNKWNMLTPRQRKTFLRRFLRKHPNYFRAGGSPKNRLAKRIITDMAATASDLKFDDVNEFLREVKKRLWTSYLMGKSQRARRGDGRLKRAFAYPNRGRAKNCDPQVNVAATKYWTGRIGPKNNYKFLLSENLGKKDAYTAITKLFVRQKNICNRTLIHCDNLLSLIHFRAFAESMGKAKFNEQIKKGTIKVSLHHYGFSHILEARGRPKEAISLKWVVPARREDFIIGDHVYFHNHPAYDVMIQGVGGVWRLENAILVDRKGSRPSDDLFQGHGYFKGPVTEDRMKNDMRKRFQEVLNIVNKLIYQSKSKNPSERESAIKELKKYTGLRKIRGEYWIKGTAFVKSHKIPISIPLPKSAPPGDRFPGLYHPNPTMRNQFYHVYRPVEST